jgi:fermentation-respiration switch protein FrsA (DUF1100 family)
MSKTSSEQRSITFLSDGLVIHGVLRLPRGNRPCPIVILGHGLGGLKEWTLPEVAAALVDVGIAAMWFDYRNVGDSEGQPRDEVAHYGRIEDWHSAISFAGSLPEVDAMNIGIWGTSLGGRDVLAVASVEKRVKAVVAQTPLIKWSPALAARMGGFGDDVERYYQELDDDRQNRALGKDPRYMPYVKKVGDDAKIAYLGSLGTAELRNYTSRITLQSFRPTALVDVTPLVELITPTPILFILAEEDFLPGQREAYEAAKEPKSLVMVGGNHFSPYMTSKKESIEATKKWFIKYLIEK